MSRFAVSGRDTESTQHLRHLPLITRDCHNLFKRNLFCFKHSYFVSSNEVYGGWGWVGGCLFLFPSFFAVHKRYYLASTINAFLDFWKK